MRICYLADAASPHSERWCRYFADAGHDVHVFSLRPAVIPGVLVHQLCPWWPGKSGYITAVGRLREMLHHLKPDLVHAHYLTSYGLLGVMAGYRPLIVSMWGSDVLAFPRRSPLHAALVRRIMAKADLLMSTSQAMVTQTADLRPAGKPVHVTPFGVDTTVFHPGEALPDEPVVVGTVSLLIPRKRIDLLIGAFAELARRPGSPPMRLLIVGDGESRPELAAQARALGIHDRIDWTGWVPAEAVPALMSRMSVVVLPSRQEAFGVVALEAAASGRPIVATRIDGFVESVAEGVSGLLVPPDDQAALTAALATLVDDPDRRRAMGRSAREWVCQTYRWELTAERMARLYDELLAARAVRHA